MKFKADLIVLSILPFQHDQKITELYILKNSNFDETMEILQQQIFPVDIIWPSNIKKENNF